VFTLENIKCAKWCCLVGGIEKIMEVTVIISHWETVGRIDSRALDIKILKHWSSYDLKEKGPAGDLEQLRFGVFEGVQRRDSIITKCWSEICMRCLLGTGRKLTWAWDTNKKVASKIPLPERWERMIRIVDVIVQERRENLYMWVWDQLWLEK